MLKWFRIYNKWLLVVLGSLLMVVFLVEGALYGIMPKQGDQVLGHVNGQAITFNDQSQANLELELIGRVMPALTLLAPHDPQQWLMLVQGAKQMGISASNTEVAQLLGMFNGAQESIDALARTARVTPQQLTEAVRHWLIVQQYVELISGLSHMSLPERMSTLQQGIQYMNMGLTSPQMVIDPARGQPRISRPLIERFIQDQQATVTMQAVGIGPEHRILDMPEPDEKTVEALYDEYKDELPGSDKGYGLGYKLPDRVQLEYLTIPIESVRQQIHLQESQMVAYYDEHPKEFTDAPDQPATSQPSQAAPAAKPKPYLDVRDQIQDQLTDKAAGKLAQRIAQAAYTSLIENARPLADKAGYRVLNDTWTPMRLEDLAKDLQKRFDVTVEVRRIDKTWLTLPEVQRLPGLGQSSLALGQQALPTAIYIASVRELKPKSDNPALNLHLQTYLPSHQVEGHDGSLYLFRVTNAQPTHTPPLSDIHKHVALDAQRVAAYKANLANMDQWKKMLAEPLAKAARTLNTQVIGPASFNRRNTYAGVMQVPVVPGVGSSSDFVDKVFDLALKDNDKPDTQPAAKPSPASQDFEAAGVVPVDDKLTVYLVKVIDFKRMSKRDFDQQMSLSFNKIWVNMAMTRGLESDPFSVDNLAKRVGFKWADPSRHKQQGQDQPDDQSTQGDTTPAS